MSENHQKFIMFGCWNQYECSMERGTNPLSRTMQKLHNYVSKNPTDFIIVAGDNYYPEKDKSRGTKKIVFSNLESGFDCLPTDIETDVILGNHDLETNLRDENGNIIEKLVIEDDTVESGNCDILTKEQEIMKSRQNMNIELYGIRMFGNTMIIKFDTSMYEEDVDEYKRCYEKFKKNNRKNRNFSQIKTRQESLIRKWVKEAISKNSKNIIFVGHHPLVSHKLKKDKVKTSCSTPLIEFISSLGLEDSNINKYYLCADVHFYQESDVLIDFVRGKNQKEILFRQYVVGTGGTELDTPSNDNKTKIVEMENINVSIRNIH